MAHGRWRAILMTAILWSIASLTFAQQAQQSGPHIGYVYPAGGRQGTTFQVTTGGQFLGDVGSAYVSGSGVRATVVEHVKPLTQMQANLLRDKLQELQDKKLASFVNTPGRSGTTTRPSTRPSTKPLWTADDEKQLAEIRAKLATFIRRPSSPAIAEIVTLQVTVVANAEVGEHELRLSTPAGLTNPLVFCVGQLPEFSEPTAKPSGEPTGAVKREEMNITLPATVNGQTLPGGVDRFKFQARRGQRLVVAVAARKLMPYLADAVPGWFQATVAMYDAKGNEVAYDDDFRFDPDPALCYLVPKDGEYTIEIKDAIYRGREDFVYRITIAEVPFITSIFPLGARVGEQTTVEVKGWNLPLSKITPNSKELGIHPLTLLRGAWVSNCMPFAVDDLPECLEQEPNGTAENAQQVALPIIVNGRIDNRADRDVFRFDGHAGG